MSALAADVEQLAHHKFEITTLLAEDPMRFQCRPATAYRMLRERMEVELIQQVFLAAEVGKAAGIP